MCAYVFTVNAVSLAVRHRGEITETTLFGSVKKKTFKMNNGSNILMFDSVGYTGKVKIRGVYFWAYN